jgi:hypothetical protein
MARVISDNVNWARVADVARHPENYFPLDDELLAMMEAAPIDRCHCPLPAHERCHVHRCAQCEQSMRAVVAYIEAADDVGNRLPRRYLFQAFILNVEYWNRVRRGLMLPPRPPLQAVICTVCLEGVQSDTHALPCAHVFHGRCVRPWLRRQRTCPTCRAAA